MLFGTVHIYGVLIALAIGLGVYLCLKRERRMGLKKDTSIDLALWVIPAALVGARLYYVAFQWDMYRQDLISILYVWKGGLAIYGGVIGGVIAGAFFAKRKKAPFFVLADLVAPAAAMSSVAPFRTSHQASRGLRIRHHRSRLAVFPRGRAGGRNLAPGDVLL